MYTKTSLALALVIALSSGAVAAEKKRQPPPRTGWDAYAATRIEAPPTPCLHGVWDPYAKRCDASE